MNWKTPRLAPLIRRFRRLRLYHPVVFLIGCWLLSSAVAEQKPTQMSDSLQSLASDFWEWRARYQPFSKDDIPRIDHPAGRRDWSATSLTKQRKDLSRYEARWKQIDPTGWTVAERVDYRLMGSAMARVRWELDLNRRWERDPSFYLDQTLTALLEALLEPPPFNADRSREIGTRMEEIPEILAEGRKNLRPVRPFAQLALDDLEQVRRKLLRVQAEVAPLLQGKSGEAGSGAGFKQSTEKAITALESYQSWLQQELGKMPGNAGVGRANYEFFLNQIALLPYSPDQLFRISAQEWARAVSFEQYEKVRNQGLPELKLAANLDEQIEQSQGQELAIRKFLEDKGILTVPVEIRHYTIRPMPGYLEALGNFGELDDFTGPSRLHDDGVRWMSPPAQNLGYFWLATAKDARPDMVHEGVPGHYFQMSLSWKHEDPIRRHYYDSGANEGIGFYAEEMMLQAGLFDDSPRTREIIYNFMRLRALRVEVDVKLALGTFTIKQAADYLAQHVPMDQKTAEAEAALFGTTPGQAISYQIGKNEILRFLADARVAQGDKFSLRAFDDFLWKNGNVPIALVRWEYLGKEDDIRMLDKQRHAVALRK
jgi:uncharacterized protein (DUF885 family)